MARRIFFVACAICVSGWMLAAVERATFILTDGERISGTVVFHTDSRENLINGSLNIGLGEGKEQNFKIEQVAVIDFIGGTPRRSELAALPEGPGHLLVLRDGTTRQGQFVNMIGGDTLRWRNEGGSTEDMPITKVARVYLNSESARNTFNYSPGPTGTTGDRTQSINQSRRGGDIVVRADTPWNDSGIDVRRGEVITFVTRGRIMFGTDPSQTATPNGNESMKNETYPVPQLPVGALIGRIGNGAPFAIGGNRSGVSMPASGRLMLGVNDDHFPDNSGSFYVTLVRGQ
jgi:hypothetical protein